MRRDAGAVDQNINRPIAQHRLRGPLHGVRGGDIDHLCPHALAPGGQLASDRLGERVFPDIPQHDIGATLEQGRRRATSDTARTAGDDHAEVCYVE
jgi:hypothetical protein